MMPSTKTPLRRSAALALMSVIIMACQFLATGQGSPVVPTPGTAVQLPGSPYPTATREHTTEPSASETPTALVSAVRPLAVRDTIPLDIANSKLGFSVAASPGKVWVGTGKGTVEEYDAQTGAFVQSIALQSGGPLGSFVSQLAYDGQVIAAFEQLINQAEPPRTFLFLIDPGSGAVVHKWDMQSPEWNAEQSEDRVTAFGVSPGKIWLDGRVVDTKTFEITPDVYFPLYTQFGYNGNGWMWMTGDTGGGCDDLVFAPVDDPTQGICEERLPFLHSGDELGDVYPELSIMTLAGDTMWMFGSGEGGGENVALNAYPADMDALMKESGPLASVPLQENAEIGLLYAGNYLWLLWEGGEQAGMLVKLDPQTGETLDSLDLTGNMGRAQDMPVGLATDGTDLWVVTVFRLLRIKL